MIDQTGPERIGEVVEAASTSFLAQCYKLYQTPPLGSLVRAGEPPTHGVVFRVFTEPLDPYRPVLARGESAATEEEVFRENPQLERLLNSRFEVLVLGHQSNGAPVPALPPQPPRVHAFVYACDAGEVTRLIDGGGWLRSLLSANIPASEQVVGACLRQAAACAPEPEAFLIRVCRELAGELAGDLPRLNAILKVVRQ